MICYMSYISLSYLMVGHVFLWHLIHLHRLLFLCNLVRQNTLGLNSLAHVAGLSKDQDKVKHIMRSSIRIMLIAPLYMAAVATHHCIACFSRDWFLSSCCVHLMKKRHHNEWVKKQLVNLPMHLFLPSLTNVPCFRWQVIQLIADLFFSFDFESSIRILSEDLRALDMFSCTSWSFSCLSVVQYHCLLAILRSH